jgi:hypothetical protein
MTPEKTISGATSLSGLGDGHEPVENAGHLGMFSFARAATPSCVRQTARGIKEEMEATTRPDANLIGTVHVVREQYPAVVVTMR